MVETCKVSMGKFQVKISVHLIFAIIWHLLAKKAIVPRSVQHKIARTDMTDVIAY